jgi:hypothetical protein
MLQYGGKVTWLKKIIVCGVARRGTCITQKNITITKKEKHVTKGVKSNMTSETERTQQQEIRSMLQLYYDTDNIIMKKGINGEWRCKIPEPYCGSNLIKLLEDIGYKINGFSNLNGKFGYEIELNVRPISDEDLAWVTCK